MSDQSSESSSLTGEEIPSVRPKAKYDSKAYMKAYNARKRAEKLAAKANGTSPATSSPAGKVEPKEPKGSPIPQGLVEAGVDALYTGIGMALMMKTGRPLVIPGTENKSPIKFGPEQVRASYEESKRAFVDWMKTANVRLPPWAMAIGSMVMTVGGAVAVDVSGLMAQAQAIAMAQAAAAQAGPPPPGVKLAQDMTESERMGASPTNGANGHIDYSGASSPDFHVTMTPDDEPVVIR